MGGIKLFEEKEQCCGCGACLNICPKSAISMQEDEYGFTYPHIDETLCVGCGQCKKVCSYQDENVSLHEPITAYAAAGTDSELIKLSASGGIFASLAECILECGGIVYGCAFSQKDGSLYPEHVRLTDKRELYKVQGSKYVQSASGDSYRHVKSDLQRGKKVLFSGTPCQVAALNGFLGKMDRSNLLTVDIICHGTPSSKLFQDYICELGRSIKGTITDFKFRDKAGGWGLKGAVYYTNKHNQSKKRLIPVQLSSYYSLFLKSETYRENCYSCQYAGEKRPGDITIGDYWGIEDEHPEYAKENGGKFDFSDGVSCVLVNTENGRNWLETLNPQISFAESTFKQVQNRNHQLKAPSQHTQIREKVLKLYAEKGYAAIDEWYYNGLGFKKYIYEAWNLLPRKVQLLIKKCSS